MPPSPNCMIPAITISCITSIYGRADGFEWDGWLTMSVKQLNFSFQDFVSLRLQFPLDMQTFIDILYPLCLNKKSRKCLNVHSVCTNFCLNVHGVCTNLCLNVHSPCLSCSPFEYGKGMYKFVFFANVHIVIEKLSQP